MLVKTQYESVRFAKSMNIHEFLSTVDVARQKLENTKAAVLQAVSRKKSNKIIYIFLSFL